MDAALARLYKSEDSYARMRDFYDDSLADLPVPVQSQYVDTRFGSTHMLTAGDPDAPPLVLLQGMAGSAILWHQQFADLSAERRVLALDTVGQPGRSAPNPLPLTDDSYQQWLLDVLDSMQLQRADFMGVSLAGWVLMRLSLQSPDRVRSNVLLSPMRLARAKMDGRQWAKNARRNDGDESLEDSLTARDFTPSTTGREYDRRLARAMALATKHYRLGVGMGMDPDSSPVVKAGVASSVMRIVGTPMRKAELKAITTPTLIVIGEHEMLYKPQNAVKRAALIPTARIEVVPEAGHAAIYDRPELVNRMVLDYLAEPKPSD
jgi:pimeloyl-ACP methyl ester carboxylesterase